MCRLLGIYGEVKFWRTIALDFRLLAEHGQVPPICIEPGHKDGWGMAKSDDDKAAMLEITRQLGSAHDSSIYQNAIHTLGDQPHVLLCHIRKASPDIPVTIGNVHPFLKREWAFIHNGTIYDPEKLPGDPSYQLTSDGSDSEYYFCYLLSALANADDTSKKINVLSDAMASLKISYSAANCILSNGSELFAIRDYQKFGDYLSLFYYRFPKGIIICSEPLALPELDPSKWQMMPNRSILRISGSLPEIEMIKYGQ